MSQYRHSRSYLAALVVFHLALPLALVPSLFSWTGVWLFAIGGYVYGGLGISLGYHRLFSHRALALPRRFERAVAVLGVCSLMETPARYAATHRVHHRHADTSADPHSPQERWWWGHMIWLIWKDAAHDRRQLARRYAADVLADPFYTWLERRRGWLIVYMLHAIAYFAAGVAAGRWVGNSWADAARFGASLVVWGVIVRTLFVWHTIWAVNSWTHRWGYRNYDTPDNSRNNVVLALLTNGEGWHNNHHAHPARAGFGERWWELDVTYLTVRALEAVGLATRVRHAEADD